MPVPTHGTPVDVLAAPTALPVAPNAPMVHVHWTGRPGSWRVVEEGFEAPTWVPSVDALILQPGANGVATAEDGAAPNYDQMQLSVRRDGGILIEGEQAILAGACQCPRTKASGTYYYERWTTIEPPPYPGASAHLRVDRAARNAWAVDLVRRGKIPAPPASLLSLAIARAESDLQRALTARDLRDEVRDARIARAREQVARVRGAVKPWETPASEPAKKRGAA